jgi:hypothetical protein
MQRRRFSFPRCCCAVLCCVAVLLSTRSPPHAVLLVLVTALSLSVVVHVLREGARVTRVCWCWLLCCRGALVLSPSSQSLVCRGRTAACSLACRFVPSSQEQARRPSQGGYLLLLLSYQRAASGPALQDSTAIAPYRAPPPLVDILCYILLIPCAALSGTQL